jgi:hypothetical protein
MARFKIVNGVRVQLTPEEETIRDAEEEKAAIEKTEFDALEYSRNRAKEYPPIVDQLDDIYHNGIDAWKATIKVTKDKYPKP